MVSQRDQQQYCNTFSVNGFYGNSLKCYTKVWTGYTREHSPKVTQYKCDT